MKQTILFLPGLLNDGRLYAGQMAALAETADCRAIVLDFANDISDLAQGVLEQAPEQFSLAALSMGGYVGFEIIRQLQARGQLDRLQKLALMNTSARADTAEQSKTRHGLIKLSRLGRFKGVTPRLMHHLLGAAARQNIAVTSLITAMAESIGQQGFERQQEAIISRADARELLQRITTPTLVIGGVNDKLTPPVVMQEIADGINGAELHILDNCGHLSPLEQSDKVTALLQEFFSQPE